MAILLFTAAAARCGGLDNAMGDDSAAAGPCFFGFVFDENGSTVSGATITLTVKTGETVSLRTNILGMYRSHIAPTATRDNVSAVCAKAGHAYLRTVVRPSEGARTVEIDCFLRHS